MSNKITAYETSDGEIFKDEKKAEIHQLRINFEFRLKSFSEKYGVYSDGKDQLYNILLNHSSELKKILNNE
jgi:hypothetical protein